jgi:iron complex transport system substrate-binding protein
MIRGKHLYGLQAVTLIVSLLLAIGLMGCSSPGSTTEQQPPEPAPVEEPAVAAGPVTFIDALGSEVTVDQPQRVVAGMGSFAAIWELSGGKLVGVTTDAQPDYTIVSDAQSIGEYTAPDMERIIALEPDLVILSAAASGRPGVPSQVDLKESLEGSGITTAYFDVTTFSDYLAMLDICALINGRSDLYEQYGSAIKAQIEQITDAVPGNKSPSALLMLTYSGGIRVQGSSTMVGAMLADLGVRNLADDNPSLLKDFSIEAVIEQNPDFIFAVPMGISDEDAATSLKAVTEANPAWAELGAVKGGHYFILDSKHFSFKPNELWAESYQILYDALYS